MKKFLHVDKRHISSRDRGLKFSPKKEIDNSDLEMHYLGYYEVNFFLFIEKIDILSIYTFVVNT